VLSLFLLPLLSAGQELVTPTRTELAPGIFLFSRPGYGDVGLDGNSIVVTSRDGVLVFDTNGTPGASAAVLAEIRQLTSQPVRWIVNSHWHWDHWYGTEVYADAFPDVRVVAQETTRALMMGPALEFNRPGLEDDLPGYLDAFGKQVDAAKAKMPPAANLVALQARLDDDRLFLQQKLAARHVFPNVTYSRRLDLYLGERHIEVRNEGRAITPGDSFLYLPDEKILVSGDLLIDPVTFALSCYPTEWLHTLEQIDALAWTTLVPGHGAPQHDRALLHATMAALKQVIDEGTSARARGLDPDQAREDIWPRLHDPMVAITHDVPAVNDAFKIQFVDWCLHRVYDELSGPLTDAIAPIPPK
jgi:glyoxylase-like metal-dependent hydrolase (beta-lactamase superfamily II)